MQYKIKQRVPTQREIEIYKLKVVIYLSLIFTGLTILIGGLGYMAYYINQLSKGILP